MGKQKIYKSLFSILLTGICVTAVTYAASVSYIKDGEVLTESYMTSLVSALNGKANLSDVYTKAQVDAKIPNCSEGQFVTANGTGFTCAGATEVTPPSQPSFDCNEKTFNIYTYGARKDYTLPTGNLGDEKSSNGHEYGCEYYPSRFEASRPGSQDINYTFTCTSSGWIKEEFKGPCTDAMYR